MAKDESNFNLMYGHVKDFVVANLLSRKFGEVVVLMEDMPTNVYVSASWLELILNKLSTELNTEYGVTNVHFRKPDSTTSTKAAIVIF